MGIVDLLSSLQCVTDCRKSGRSEGLFIETDGSHTRRVGMILKEYNYRMMDVAGQHENHVYIYAVHESSTLWQ